MTTAEWILLKCAGCAQGISCIETGFVVLVWIVNLKEKIHFKGQIADASNYMYPIHSLVSKQLVVSAFVMLVGCYRQNICLAVRNFIFGTGTVKSLAQTSASYCIEKLGSFNKTGTK